jgi:leucyl aminopeptidase
MPVDAYEGDAVVVALAQGEGLSGAAAQADAALQGLLARLVASGETQGKAGEVTILHTQGKLPALRLAVAGLGAGGTGDAFALRRAMGAAARTLRDRGCRRVGTTLHTLAPGTGARDQGPRAVVEATYLGLYPGAERKTQPASPGDFDELCLLQVPPQYTEAARAAAQAGAIGGEAANYARRLVNLPANQVTPGYLADEARRLAAETGMEVEVLEPARMQELGMGALLAVAQGSQEPARLILLRHRGAENGRRLAFLGKGMTFDSGGLSIKPSDGMHLMKGDMAGAAAVLGAMWAIARRKLALDVMGVIPAAENLPSGRAYRPGDVLTGLGGKTIEVISTDAEGRLMLADALAYARQLGATHLIDIATLTGACVIALGHVAAGVLGNDNDLVEAILDSADLAGERMWRLPLFPEYRRQLDSQVADLKNVGGRPAGAITGAWFLQEFVGDTSWVHIDVAGTAWSEKDEPHQVEGATGAGAPTLIALAERMAGGLI